nr:hypothetical protein B0A51_12401 [Rachicladosporium sp. CCFEE 5018]
MARPCKVSITTTSKASPLRTKAKTATPKGRASPRKATPSAKVLESAADTVRTGRVIKGAAAKGAASPSKRATSQTASPPKGAATPAKRAVSPAKPQKAPNPTLLLRLARSASPAKASARANAKSASPSPQFTGDGVTEVYTSWDLEQFEPIAKGAVEDMDGSFPALKAAWTLLRNNAFLDGRAKAGETSAAITARSLYRALKKATKQDMGPEFDEAWKKGVTAAKLRGYLESTGEDIRDNALAPTVTPPRGRPVAPRSPGKTGEVQEGRVTKPHNPSKVRSPSKAAAQNSSKTRSQSPLKKVNSGDSGVVIVDQTKEKQELVRPESPAKPIVTTKGKGKPSASPARPYRDNRVCLPHTRGKVISCTNLEFISDEKGKHNPFFETLPSPEVWHRRMPPYFPFGETPLMEAYVSRQIDEDLQRGVAHDQEVQNKNRSVVGRVFNAGQKAASYMGSMVPWRRSEDRRYPPAWSLPEVDDNEIAVFTQIGNGKATARKSSRA